MRISPRKSAVASLVAIWLSVFAAAPALAQQAAPAAPAPGPSIDFGINYSDNLRFLGAAGGSDTVYRLGLTLPWEKDTRTLRTQLRYRGVLERYKESDALDHDEHEASVTVLRTARRGSFNASAGFAITQNQGTFDEENDLQALAPRAEFERFYVQAGINRSLSRRWTWSSTLAVRKQSVDEIAGFAPAAANQFEDRVDTDAGIGFNRTLSRNMSVGARYTYREFDLDVSPDERAHQLSMTFARQFGRRGAFQARLGIARRERDLNDPALDDSDESVQGGVGYSRTLRRVAFAVNADHAPSSGGALRGAATRSSVRLVLGSVDNGRWSWNGGIGYALRQPQGAGNDIATRSEYFGVSFGTRRKFGVSADVSHTDQQETGAQGFDGEYFSAGVSLVWRPLGR
jgi:hypothetical protein